DYCLDQIKRQMKPTTHLIIVWALTPYGWRRTSIRTRGKPDTTIFRPATFFSLQDIPRHMNQIMSYTQYDSDDADTEASITVRDFINERKRRRNSNSRELIKDLDKIIKNAKKEQEILKRRNVKLVIGRLPYKVNVLITL
ncbi:hypothetical protein Anas_14532, partial [Armadillidium nasatum]